MLFLLVTLYQYYNFKVIYRYSVSDQKMQNIIMNKVEVRKLNMKNNYLTLKKRRKNNSL